MRFSGLGRFRRPASITALFVVLTTLMTWPQVRFLATRSVEHQDIYFNLWRLRWIAHALATAPSRLFNGNQFHPEPRTLAFSDAMLVEGLIGAPLLWIGIPPMLVHNLLLLGAMVASAAGICVLARHLTGSTAGGIIAGIVFAFAPYRFDHYMHMELQWTVWMPWAFWALQRTLETGSWRFGALTGAFMALQMTSSVYYGLFLAVLLGIVAAVQLVTLPRDRVLRTVGALALGAALLGAVSAAYSVPYAAAAKRVGARGDNEITMFSARPRDYRAATPDNVMYGSRRGAPERRLFPGVTPLVLALAGLLLVGPRPVPVAYAIGLGMSFELSLGMFGLLYPFLHEHVGVFGGLRAPARASVFGLMFLGVLAAQGYAAAAELVRPTARRVAAVALAAFLLLEYRVAPLALIPYRNEAPPLYAFLAQQPRGVVAEFPMPESASRLPGEEWRYLYMSTFHWMPLLNGYSGYYPPVYVHRLVPLSRFPDENSLNWLRRSDVHYVIVHSGGYEPEKRLEIIEGLLTSPGVTHIGDFEDGWGDGAIFRLR